MLNSSFSNDKNKVEEMQKNKKRLLEMGGCGQISSLSLSCFMLIILSITITSAVMMDRLTDGVRQESLWTMMFAGNIVTSSESREQVEKRSGGMLWRIGEWKSAETR